MAIDNSLLLREVGNVIENGMGLRHYEISCQLLLPDRWFSPLRVTLLDLERDYEEGYGDARVLEITVGIGDYAYLLFPNRDRMYADITIRPLIRSDREVEDNEAKVRRYRVILMDQDNPGMVGRSPQASNHDDLNTTGVRQVQLMLLTEELYQIRMTMVGRLYRDVTPAIALKSLLTETTSVLDVKDNQSIFGVNMVEGYNESPRSHITIKHGTPLVDVATLLQNEQGGIYGQGVGCYLQDGYWWVFPPYNTERYDRTPRTLTVLSIPPNRYYGAEHTYRVTENQVVIVAASDMDTEDSGLFQQLDEGNALRFGDANKYLTYGEVENNKVVLTRQENMYEFQGVELQTGMNHARWTKDRATSNPFKHYSEIARRNGRYVAVQWLHGDSSVLYPGMPVKFMALVNDVQATFYGTLLGVQDQRIPNKPGMTAREYSSSVSLKLFLIRKDTPV